MVQTRAGNLVPNLLVEKDLPSGALREREEFQRRRDPAGMNPADLIRLSDTYNCVGLAFASRRVEIAPEHIRQFLIEDGYRKIELAKVRVGDAVLYWPDDAPNFALHIGIVVWVPRSGDYFGTETIRVLSKFGRCGEYCHAIANVPRGVGKPREYHTQRKEGYE
jgi:hypothetical protein